MFNSRNAKPNFLWKLFVCFFFGSNKNVKTDELFFLQIFNLLEILQANQENL